MPASALTLLFGDLPQLRDEGLPSVERLRHRVLASPEGTGWPADAQSSGQGERSQIGGPAWRGGAVRIGFHVIEERFEGTDERPGCVADRVVGAASNDPAAAAQIEARRPIIQGEYRSRCTVKAPVQERPVDAAFRRTALPSGVRRRAGQSLIAEAVEHIETFGRLSRTTFGLTPPEHAADRVAVSAAWRQMASFLTHVR